MTLCNAVNGLAKSFSTSDLISLEQFIGSDGLRKSVSECGNNCVYEMSGFRPMSRSCSTFVVVGDLMSCASIQSSE